MEPDFCKDHEELSFVGENPFFLLSVGHVLAKIQNDNCVYLTKRHEKEKEYVLLATPFWHSP